MRRIKRRVMKTQDIVWKVSGHRKEVTKRDQVTQLAELRANQARLIEVFRLFGKQLQALPRPLQALVAADNADIA